MRKKAIFILALLMLTLISGVVFANNYDSQTPDNDSIKNAPIRLVDNYSMYFSKIDGKEVTLLKLDNFDKSRLSGYISKSALKTGATRVKEGLGTLNQVITSWPEPLKSYPVDIAPNRVVYYSITQYPDFIIRYGNIENATVQQVWDFETGESLGFNVMGKKSADFHGPNE